MVKNAGIANTQFKIPVPIDASSALDSENPESVNTVVE